MLVLEAIHLENFKSYRESESIHFRQFTSIFGPNGAGKSCLVDAIKFAFCFSPYDKISMNSLKEEVRNNDGNDMSTWVKVLINADNKVTTFQRTIDYDESKSIYYINDQEVERKIYKEYLLNFNINPKANNIFIEQNMVENFLMMEPKERSAFFEQLCGSIVHKSEYISILKELKAVDAEKKSLLSDKKFYVQRQKVLKNLAYETEQHNDLSKKLEQLEYDYHYTKLYDMDYTIEKALKELAKFEEDSNTTVRVMIKLKESAEVEITKIKSDIAKNMKELDAYEDKVQEKKEKIEENLTEMLQVNQKVTAVKDQIAKLETNLKQARKMDEARENTVKDLESQLLQAEEDKKVFSTSQASQCSIELEDQKYMEYLKLKSEAEIKSAKEISLLDSIERERESIKDKIEDVTRRKELVIEHIKKQQFECDNLNKQINRIEQNIQETESAEKDMQEKCHELGKKSELLKQNLGILREQIDTLNLQLSESKDSVYENQKSKRKQEVLNTLKCNFKGVKDRLINLCTLSDERYQVAITKLMHNKMDAIVVDNENTARECIKFLKMKYQGEKYSTIETFLPIDYVKTKPLEKALSVVQESPDSKIALFVMRSTSKDIKTVLHHVLGNVIICETDDEALELSGKHHLDCVSLSGTFFKSNGIISGGLASLLEKSKEWTFKDREKLKNDKAVKIASLRSTEIELRQTLEPYQRMFAELSALNKKLENHLIPLLKEKKRDLVNKKLELSELENCFNTFDENHKLRELQKELEVKNKEYEQVEREKNKIEDKVFKKFCDNLQIPNIRVYEQGDFKKSQIRANREKEYDNLIDQIKNQIKYEKARDTKTTIKNLESRIERERKTFNDLSKKKDKLNALIEKRRSSISDDQLKLIKKTIDELKKKLKLKENECKLIEADLKTHKSKVLAKSAQVLNLRADKHELLIECKLKNIRIPLFGKTIDQVLLKTGVDTTIRAQTSSSSDATLDESQIKEKDVEVDYAKLSKPPRNNIKKHLKSLENQITETREKLEKLAQHLNVKDDLQQVTERLKEIHDNVDKTVKKIKVLRKKFEEKKTERSSLFKEFVDSLQEKVDKVYKDIYRNETAQAYIVLRNLEEPYLEGIDFDCIIPGKQMISLNSISGAEKAICALSLLIGIHQLKPSPCLIFDEVDAPIDLNNQIKLYSYLEKLKSSIQIMVISHQMSVNLYANVAISIRLNSMLSSAALHIDLTKYKKEMDGSFNKSSMSDRLYSLAKRLSILSTSSSRYFIPRLPTTSGSAMEITEESERLHDSIE